MAQRSNVHDTVFIGSLPYGKYIIYELHIYKDADSPQCAFK